MREQDVEVMATVAVRHDDGYAVSRDAVTGPRDAARQQRGVLANNVRLSVGVFVVNGDEHTTAYIQISQLI